MNWRISFPKANSYHLGVVNSNHYPFLLDTNRVESFSPKHLYFVASWTRDQVCHEVIIATWKT